MPKTGGTFITSVLMNLHGPIDGASVSPYGPIVNVEPKHGTCHDIPVADCAKPILSSVRNPYDWYVSQYEFGWWKRIFLYDPTGQPTPAGYAIEKALPEFQNHHPHFPDISFEEFLQLCHRAAFIYDGGAAGGLGLYTHGFVRYYFRRPADALSCLSPEYLSAGLFITDMFQVRFIRTDCLKQGLQDFLASMAYRQEDLVFISGLGKILPDGRGRRDDQRWESYYTPALKQYVRERDRVVFSIFPEFDV